VRTLKEVGRRADSGDMRPVRRAGSILPLVLALALAVGPAAPVRASSLKDLHRARQQLRELTTRLETRQQAIARTDARLALLAAAVDRVTAHLAELRRREGELDAEIGRLHSRLAVLEHRFDELVGTQYMNGPTAQLGLVLGIVLGSDSMSDLTDGMEYASRISAQTMSAASEVTALRTRLSSRVAELDTVRTTKRALADDLTGERRRVHRLNGQQRDAYERVAQTRDRILALVRNLRQELAAYLFPLIGTAFQGGAHTSYGRWAVLFLQSLDAPVCRSNEIVVVAWQLAEFTQAAWNPLATTRPMPGSTAFNSAGVQNFPTLEVGLLANQLTLMNGWASYRYGAIVSSLRACADPYATANAIRASAWCHGCANGEYVVNKVGQVAADFATYAAL
jgi:peptidoglycan hydrolase CwlO-like protein